RHRNLEHLAPAGTAVARLPNRRHGAWSPPLRKRHHGDLIGVDRIDRDARLGVFEIHRIGVVGGDIHHGERRSLRTGESPPLAERQNYSQREAHLPRPAARLHRVASSKISAIAAGTSIMARSTRPRCGARSLSTKTIAPSA